MKYIFLFAFLLAAASIASAQSVKVTSGKTISKGELDDMSIGYQSFMTQEFDGRSRSHHFVYTNDKVLLMGIARDRDKQYRFGVLKDYINVIGSKVMKLEMAVIEDARYRILKIDQVDSKRFVFYTNGRGEEDVLYVNQMDDNLVLLGSPIKLMEPQKKYPSTSVHISEDKKSVLIFQYGVGDYNDDKSALQTSRENQGVSCSLLDGQFGQIWQTEFDMPFRQSKGYIGQVAIDNTHNMYILTYQGKEKDQRATLHQYFPKTKEWKSTPLGRPNTRISGCMLKVLNGTTPVVAGLYGSGDNSGYFVTAVDVVSQTAKNILSKPFAGDYTLWDKSTEFYDVTNMVMTDNGNITFSIEAASRMKSAVNSAIFYYNFSSVFLKQVDTTGKEVWQRLALKTQRMEFVPNGGGHALIAKGNDIIVLYNDHADNNKIGVDEKKAKPKVYTRDKTTLVAQTIDPTGKASKEVIVPTGIDPKYCVDPRIMIRLEENIYLTEFWKTAGKPWAYSYATVEVH